MKKSNKLFSGLAVIILLGAALLYIRSDGSDDDPIGERPVSELIENDDDSRTLLFLKNDEVSSIQFISSSETVLFENDGSTWTVNKGEYNHVDMNKVAVVLRDILNLRSLETVGNLSHMNEQRNWGIDSSASSVIITSEGGSTTLLPGKMNPSRTGYYLQVNGSEEIYLVRLSLGKSLKLTLDDLRDRNIPTFSAGNLSSIYIENGFEMNIFPYERTDMFTADIFEYALHYYDYPIPVDPDNISSLLSDMSRPLQIVDFIDMGHPWEYGLAEGAKKLSITENSGSEFNLLIGHDVDSDFVYAKLENEEQIFTLDKSELPFLDLKPFDLVDKFAHLVSIDSIDSLSLEGRGMSISATIESDGESTVYAINGKPIEEKDFKKFYQDVLLLLVDGEVQKPVDPGESYFSITYRLKGSGSIKSEISFDLYDEEYCTVSRNGAEPLFIIGKYQIDNLLKEMQQLLSESSDM